ncbi:ribosome small subunit-dependent GTPase A [Neisseria sp. Ec49-e6-T10]|uniref:ribosome small subunit-dependent GTPase A n=1 Tax=Neisseria sp. Ec49-e6-T10 TaxID=3140744 RepID=UPI003EBFCD5A
MSHQNLRYYGLSSCFEQEALLYPHLYLARVTEQHRTLYTVVTEKGEKQASVSGKFIYQAYDNTVFPVVGDWVMVSQLDNTEQPIVIEHVLQRKSVFERKAAGTQHATQVIVANIDYIFICMSLNNDYNLRRLERYLSIAWQSSATPIIILTKSDLCSDILSKLAQIETISVGTDILIVSMMDTDIHDKFSPYLHQGKSVVFLGSSGVGKSSLVNRLLGKDVLLTQEIGNDDSGRHTTTKRQLFVLPSGGIVIDTPGMRELQLDTGNLTKAFEDVEQLSFLCKFRNCTHTNEHECAVQQAITHGNLSEGRLENYRKLVKETQYAGLNAKQLEQAKVNNMFGSIGAYKKMRRQMKNKR